MKRLFTLIVAVPLALLLLSAPAAAHGLWINLNESYAHPPGHALITLGWGHSVPLDDLLVSGHGVISLEAFDLYAPDLKRTALEKPSPKQFEVVPAAGGLTVEKGDLAVRKLTLTDKTVAGTYQVACQSEPTFFTMYLDGKGKRKMAPKPMDAIEGAKQILASFKYQSFAKAYTAVKKWTAPKPLGHALEIMPAGDLSDVHAGDLVSFEVTFNGKPVSSGAQGMYYLTATSNTFGGPDGFFLSAYLMGGKAQLRLPTAGPWVANVYIQQQVKPEAGMDELVGKCTAVYDAASLSFHVKP